MRATFYIRHNKLKNVLDLLILFGLCCVYASQFNQGPGSHEHVGEYLLVLFSQSLSFSTLVMSV